MNFGDAKRMGVWTIVVMICFAARAATNDLNFGEVKVDAADQTISFPAEVNQRVGMVEYLLVHETGKVHESIFRTKVGGQQIHAASLLFSEKSTNGLPNAKVKTIEVSWGEGELRKSFPAAELIFDKDRRRELKTTKWAYRGSKLVEGVFLAQRDGSLIAIMEDRDALIDQDTPDAANDENWEPITDKLPTIGTQVTIRVVFEMPTDRSVLK